MKISIGFLRGFFRRDSTTTLPLVRHDLENPSINFLQRKNLLFRIGRFAYGRIYLPFVSRQIQRRIVGYLEILGLNRCDRRPFIVVAGS